MIEQLLGTAQEDLPMAFFGNRVAKWGQCGLANLLQFLSHGIVDPFIRVFQKRNQRIQFGDAHCSFRFDAAK